MKLNLSKLRKKFAFWNTSGKQIPPTPKINWNAPSPLEEYEDALHAICPPVFDTRELLPSSLERYVNDESNRMQSREEFISVSCLAAIAGIVGGKFSVFPKSNDDWTVPLNLYCAIVGQPSTRKSPSIRAATKLLDPLIKRAEEKFKVESIKFASENESGEKPVRRRYLVNDATYQKIAMIVAENPFGFLLNRDELSGIISRIDRPGYEEERSFFLEAFNGNGSYHVDRISRDSLKIDRLIFSMLGGIQPDRLKSYLTNAKMGSNDGLLQRLQVLVFPSPPDWEWVDLAPDLKARFDMEKIILWLDELCPEQVLSTCARKGLFFSPKAQNVFVEWMTSNTHLANSIDSDPLLQQHVVKHDRLFVALAGILHLVQCAEQEVFCQIISHECAIMAKKWCALLYQHARKVYGLASPKSPTSRAADFMLACRILDGSIKSPFTMRELKQKEWRGLSNSKLCEEAVQSLLQKHWLASESVISKSGPAKVAFHVNPKCGKHLLQ